MKHSFYSKIQQKQSKPTSSIPSLLSSCFPEQLEFIKDSSQLKAALCSRRSGKSEAVAYYLLHTALTYPNSDSLYISLTRKSSKAIIWKRKLLKIIKEFKIDCEVNLSELTITFTNGSTIYVTGADEEDSVNKLLGNAFKLIIIDEAQSFGHHLTDLVYFTLKPTIIECKGQICLIGTPHIPFGLFFEVTNNKDPIKWSLHKWFYYNNPYVAQLIKDDLEPLIKANPNYVNTTDYRKNWLAEWVIEQDDLVYKFKPELFFIDKIPICDYNYVLGIDLGYNDATSFIVFKYSDNILYIDYSYKKSKMDFIDVANKIQSLKLQYNFLAIVVDGANKQGVETLNKRFHFQLKSAEKLGKLTNIEIINSDFQLGMIKGLRNNNEELINELQTLSWDKNKRLKGIWTEDSKCENHLTDAMLYAYKYCKHYHYTPPVIEIVEDKMMEMIEKSYMKDDDEFGNNCW